MRNKSCKSPKTTLSLYELRQMTDISNPLSYVHPTVFILLMLTIGPGKLQFIQAMM